MQKSLMLALILLMSTAWATAQEYPQSGSSQTGTAASGQTTLQGCLQGSNGNYTLTADSGTTYELQGDIDKLSKHDGHEVQITGTPSGAGASSGATNPNAGTSTETQPSPSQQTLTVDTVKHISESCTNTNKH